MTMKVGPKGQVVVPKTVRDKLGIHPGDEVDVVAEGGEVRIRRAARFRDFLGCVPAPPRGHGGLGRGDRGRAGEGGRRRQVRHTPRAVTIVLDSWAVIAVWWGEPPGATVTAYVDDADHVTS